MTQKFEVKMLIEIDDMKEFVKFLKQEDYTLDEFFSDYGGFAEGTMNNIFGDYGYNAVPFEIQDISGSIQVKKFIKKNDK